MSSSCCNAEVRVGGSGSTHWYICDKCGQGCNNNPSGVRKIKPPCNVTPEGEPE